ncbi:RNA-guided endonuclease TnpB family protein, partial [Nostoc sp.]|uniref:RNA-guided endonuclease TnpB family protein n=1 Tax=Nostoc sp. TaxID=1180 RepID=UPI002FFA12AF
STKSLRSRVSWKLSCTVLKTNGVGDNLVEFNALATCSNGFVAPNPKAYKKSKRNLRKLQKELCRRTKGGKNRDKTKLKLAKCHYRISNIRSDNLHKLTIYLAKNHSEVWVEDLNVSGLLKNHKLAGAISDCGFFEFKRQLEYKTAWYGSNLSLVDRWFPSSQQCLRLWR